MNRAIGASILIGSSGVAVGVCARRQIGHWASSVQQSGQRIWHRSGEVARAEPRRTRTTKGRSVRLPGKQRRKSCAQDFT